MGMISFVHSATVLVNDQDAALNFYVNLLGFEKRNDSPFGEGSRWIEVAPPGATTALALLRPQDMGQPGGTQGGHTGISLIADSVERTYAELSAKGVNFTAPPAQMPWGAIATWFTDPDGNSFFLTEAP
jgi:catechol 2,3-dioxygenase-like lactoylglutathione lyase family enzyme